MDHSLIERAMWQKCKLPFLRDDGRGWGKGAQNRPRCVCWSFKHKPKGNVFQGDMAACVCFSGHPHKVLQRVWQ